MTRYNVHVYREMRLVFEGIEARGRASAEADDIDASDGETFAALVDVVGDEDFRHSQMLDFETERLRRAAPLLLEALKDLFGDLPSVQGGACQHCGREYPIHPDASHAWSLPPPAGL